MCPDNQGARAGGQKSAFGAPEYRGFFDWMTQSTEEMTCEVGKGGDQFLQVL